LTNGDIGGWFGTAHLASLRCKVAMDSTKWTSRIPLMRCLLRIENLKDYKALKSIRQLGKSA
jgi:hypothetical protein